MTSIKQMEVFPDYLVDFAHVDDEPQFITVRLVDGEDWRIVRTRQVFSYRPQCQQLVDLLVDEV